MNYSMVISGFISWLIFAVVFFVISGLKVVQEYQRGVKFHLGKYVGIMNPGLRLVIPIL